jgi:hypothetical protein
MQKVIGATLLLLLGLTTSTRISQTRMSKINNNLEFAEVSADAGVAHNC